MVLGRETNTTFVPCHEERFLFSFFFFPSAVVLGNANKSAVGVLPTVTAGSCIWD